MFRAIIELVITIIIAMVARAVLTSILRGVGNASRNTFSGGQTNTPPTAANPTGELHKDPVCGTYVAESTRFRRQAPGQTFYYCSESCREKHVLVAQ
jgi:hypothetical protein